jgi:hypothetical protein
MSWDFVYRGTKFFVPTFAPFYHPNHPRYSHHEGTAFIVFQPDHCFDRHEINSKSPDRHKITETVRDLFEKGGVPYDVELVVHSIKAVRYIKPLLISDSPVRWWERDVKDVP